MTKCFQTRMPRPFSGGKDCILNKWCWEYQISTCKGIKWDLYLMPYTKINAKWIRTKGKTQNCKTSRRKYRGKALSSDLAVISRI